MTQRIGTCLVETRNVEIEGALVRYYVIQTKQKTWANLYYDLDLDMADHVVLEPNSRLINQALTQDRLGRPAGFLPEKWLMKQVQDCLGIVPINFWQTGTFLLHGLSDGGLNPFAGVQPEGIFTALFETSDGWEAVALKFRHGVPDKASERIIRSAKLGFSMPLILKDGRVRSLGEYGSDPRVLGELRNFVDFGCDVKGLPGNFWLLIRKVLPGSAVALRKMLSGEKHVEVRDGSAMLSLEIDEFAAVIEQYGLGEHLRIERAGDEIHFTVRGPLPIQRVPLVGVGFDAAHNLIAAVVEGRQAHSAGVSSEQLAQIMLSEGAITAGLGAAGGDAGVWANVDGKFQTLSSGPYRPAPCLLIMG